MIGIYALAVIIGYLLGSIPFGLVLTRMAGTADLRDLSCRGGGPWR